MEANFGEQVRGRGVRVRGGRGQGGGGKGKAFCLPSTVFVLSVTVHPEILMKIQCFEKEIHFRNAFLFIV